MGMSDIFRVRPYREEDEREVAALWLRVFPDARDANPPATTSGESSSSRASCFSSASSAARSSAP
jgi:hypothetical protein